MVSFLFGSITKSDLFAIFNEKCITRDLAFTNWKFLKAHSLENSYSLRFTPLDEFSGSSFR